MVFLVLEYLSPFHQLCAEFPLIKHGRLVLIMFIEKITRLSGRVDPHGMLRIGKIDDPFCRWPPLDFLFARCIKEDLIINELSRT